MKAEAYFISGNGKGCYGVLKIKEGFTSTPIGREVPWREMHSTIPAWDSLPSGEYHLIRVKNQEEMD